MMGQSEIHHNEHERSFITSTLERSLGDPLGLQGHFHAPPAPAPSDSQAAPPPSLEGEGITHEATPHAHCQRGRWVQAICDTHGYERWLYRPCKRRDCEVCGLRRRKRVAWRIAQGIEILGGEHGAGWFVGTWAEDVPKSTAVRAVTRFVAWVRRQPGPRVEYALTWETTKRGRLHVNLILAPWTYLRHTKLSAAWKRLGGGPNIWIKRVGAGIGQEAAKSREGVAAYFGKWEQMVKIGRAATYSKRWPKLPDTDAPVRRAKIHYFQEWQRPSWEHPPALDPNDVQLALWQQPYENEYRDPSIPWCDCFDRVVQSADFSPRNPPISLTSPPTFLSKHHDFAVKTSALL